MISKNRRGRKAVGTDIAERVSLLGSILGLLTTAVLTTKRILRSSNVLLLLEQATLVDLVKRDPSSWELLWPFSVGILGLMQYGEREELPQCLYRIVLGARSGSHDKNAYQPKDSYFDELLYANAAGH